MSQNIEGKSRRSLFLLALQEHLFFFLIFTSLNETKNGLIKLVLSSYYVLGTVLGTRSVYHCTFIL